MDFDDPYPLRSLHHHNPWAAPDPEDGDIRSINFNSGGGNPSGSGFSFTRTYTFGGGPRSPPPRQQAGNPHDMVHAEIMRNFEGMLGGILGPAARLRGGTFGGQININGRTTTFGSGTYDTAFPAPMGGMAGPE